jgi:hypothetical protein
MCLIIHSLNELTDLHHSADRLIDTAAAAAAAAVQYRAEFNSPQQLAAVQIE